MGDSFGSTVLDTMMGVGPRRVARRLGEIAEQVGGQGFKYHAELGSMGFVLQASPNLRWAEKRSNRRWIFIGLNPEKLDEFEVRENWRCGGMEFGRMIYQGTDAQEATEQGNLAYGRMVAKYEADKKGKFHSDPEGPALYNDDKENISISDALGWKFEGAEIVRGAAVYQAHPIQDLAIAIILEKAKAPVVSAVLLPVQLDALQRLERQPGESVLDYQGRWGASDLSAVLMEKSVQGLSATTGRRHSAFQAVIQEGRSGRAL